MKKWQKYLFLALAVTAFVVVLLLLIFNPFQPKANQKVQLDELVEETNNQISGEINGDGFFITYDSDLELITIEITEDPYNEVKERAARYLKANNKIELCDQNYQFVPAPDLTYDKDDPNLNVLESCTE